MSSIHSTLRRVTLSLAAVLLFGGCQSTHDHWESAGRTYDSWMAKPRAMINKDIRPSMSQTDPVMADPAPDAAALARGWEPISYDYPNGAVVAGPTYGLSYEDRPQWLQNDYIYALMQSPLLIGEACMMPFWMIIEPPFTRLEYHGARYVPSRTVAPPLPEPVQIAPQPIVPQGPSAPNAPIEPAPSVNP